MQYRLQVNKEEKGGRVSSQSARQGNKREDVCQQLIKPKDVLTQRSPLSIVLMGSRNLGQTHKPLINERGTLTKCL